MPENGTHKRPKNGCHTKSESLQEYSAIRTITNARWLMMLLLLNLKIRSNWISILALSVYHHPVTCRRVKTVSLADGGKCEISVQLNGHSHLRMDIVAGKTSSENRANTALSRREFRCQLFHSMSVNQLFNKRD